MSAPTNAPTTSTLRQRRRDATSAEILRVATRQLAENGAAALTLRAVAREMGMAVSALYRYVDGRDGLLTLLLLDAFTGLGDGVGAAMDESLARSPGDAVAAWTAAAGAYRAWALDHPASYGLAHGTPVPGYAAPSETVPAGTLVQFHLVRLLQSVAPTLPAHLLAEMDDALDATVRSDARDLADRIGAGLPPGLLAAGVNAWAALEGQVMLEVFGHLDAVTRHPQAWFDRMVADQATRMHLAAGRPQDRPTSSIEPGPGPRARVGRASGRPDE